MQSDAGRLVCITVNWAELTDMASLLLSASPLNPKPKPLNPKSCLPVTTALVIQALPRAFAPSIATCDCELAGRAEDVP